MSKDGTPVVIGFDTSNYRTSVAAVTLDGEILVNHRELLPVSNGERGLRQSDAVFAHIWQLRDSESALREAMKDRTIAAVAASTKPRDGEESYMPVFQVGYTAGSRLAAMAEQYRREMGGQYEVGVFAVRPVLLVRARPGRHVDLAADDGLHARRLAGFIEGHRAVHDAVVRDGKGGLPQCRGALRHGVHAAGAVQEGIFAVVVQMDKGHGTALLTIPQDDTSSASAADG